MIVHNIIKNIRFLLRAQLGKLRDSDESHILRQLCVTKFTLQSHGSIVQVMGTFQKPLDAVLFA